TSDDVGALWHPHPSDERVNGSSGGAAAGSSTVGGAGGSGFFVAVPWTLIVWSGSLGSFELTVMSAVATPSVVGVYFTSRSYLPFASADCFEPITVNCGSELVKVIAALISPVLSIETLSDLFW